MEIGIVCIKIQSVFPKFRVVLSKRLNITTRTKCLEKYDMAYFKIKSGEEGSNIITYHKIDLTCTD